MLRNEESSDLKEMRSSVRLRVRETEQRSNLGDKWEDVLLRVLCE